MKTPGVIIGGGPAGAATSMYLNRLGADNVIVEKVQFPHYHIGESMNGECGGVIRDLGLEAEMKRRGCPEKQGPRCGA